MAQRNIATLGVRTIVLAPTHDYPSTPVTAPRLRVVHPGPVSTPGGPHPITMPFPKAPWTPAPKVKIPKTLPGGGNGGGGGGTKFPHGPCTCHTGKPGHYLPTGACICDETGGGGGSGGGGGGGGNGNTPPPWLASLLQALQGQNALGGGFGGGLAPSGATVIPGGGAAAGGGGNNIALMIGGVTLLGVLAYIAYEWYKSHHKGGAPGAPAASSHASE